MAYIGNNTSIQQYAPTIAYFNGNGSTTAFTLPISVASAAQILVFIENVPQNPATAFTIAGSTLTFTSAPPSGTNNVWVEYTSLQSNSIAPSQGTVQDSSFGSITEIPFVGGTSIGAGNSSAMKNRLINGACVIDQRGNGASFATSTGTNVYTLDRWRALYTQQNKYTVQQNAGSVTPPIGFVNYLGVTSSSAYTVLTAETFRIAQSIEGFNIADLQWGTANAKTITLSFWVRSSLTGTFGGALQNSASNRSYPYSYTISSANTWEQKSITIAGDTSGTWLTTNGRGVEVSFNLGAGATYSGTANTWSASELYAPTGATSVVGTNGATFYITGVQLEVGTSATGFEYRQYQQELALCQRYYAKMGAGGYSNYAGLGAGYINAANGGSYFIKYPVQMRAAATFNYSNLRADTYSTANAITSIASTFAGTDSIYMSLLMSAGGFSVGQGTMLQTNNNSAGYLELSAEL